MSVNYTDPDLDPDDPDTTTQSGEPGWRRRLEQKAKRADDLERELEATKRINAVMQAGIDVTSPHGQLFVKAYDGPADVASVKTAAETYGVLTTPPVVPQVPAAEVASAQRIDAAVAAGGEAPPPMLEGVDALKGSVADLVSKYKLTDADGQEAQRRILEQARKDGRRVAGYDE